MDIYRKALEWLDEGRSFALGTVVYTQASTPKRPVPKPSSTAKLLAAPHLYRHLHAAYPAEAALYK